MYDMRHAAMVPDRRSRADHRALPATGLGGTDQRLASVTSDHRIGDLRNRQPWILGRALADTITHPGPTPAPVSEFGHAQNSLETGDHATAPAGFGLVVAVC